jgi:hypothetical protein
MHLSHNRWLLEQLPQWELDGLITAEAARTLRERHVGDASQPGLAQMVTGSLGALLIGSGLIAVIGYNWDDFTRPVRLLFAFLPLLLAQLFSLRVLQRGSAAAAWVRETAALLQTMATGACIALVSQIYNMGGAWPDFLFFWFMLSLPLVWVLRSHSVALFYLIATAVWTVNQIEHGKPWFDSPLLYPLLLLGLLPYWPGLPGLPKREPLSISVRWAMVLSAIVGLCSVAVYVTEKQGGYVRYQAGAFLWMWTLTAAALVLFPLTPAAMVESTGRKPQVVLGTLWLLGYGITATFRDLSRDIIEGMLVAIKLPWCWGLLAVLGAFAVFACLRRRWAVLALASVALLPLVILPVAQIHGQRYTTLLSAIITLYLATMGITLIVLDFIGKVGAPRLGACLLSALILVRMADSHFSLLTKGIVFIAVGIAFLAFNYLMSRHHRQQSLATV